MGISPLYSTPRDVVIPIGITANYSDSATRTSRVQTGGLRLRERGSDSLWQVGLNPRTALEELIGLVKQTISCTAVLVGFLQGRVW